MSISLDKKTVLITGSTDGLGKALAISLSELGCKIIIHGRNKEKAEEVLKLLKGTGHTYVISDFNNPMNITKSFEEITNLDILINNTGVWNEQDTVDISPEKIIEMMNVNTTSCLVITRVLLPILLKSEFGQILNVISVAGYEIPSGYFHTTYTASKFALQGYTEGMEKEFENKNLRVMGFYPGGMDTNLFKKAGLDYKANEPWMFDVKESVESIIFMLTRSKDTNIKRMDFIKHFNS